MARTLRLNMARRPSPPGLSFRRQLVRSHSGQYYVKNAWVYWLTLLFVQAPIIRLVSPPVTPSLVWQS